MKALVGLIAATLAFAAHATTAPDPCEFDGMPMPPFHCPEKCQGEGNCTRGLGNSRD